SSRGTCTPSGAAIRRCRCRRTTPMGHRRTAPLSASSLAVLRSPRPTARRCRCCQTSSWPNYQHGKEIAHRPNPQTKVAAVATTQVQKWTGGGRVQGGCQVVRS
ncbi:unnamed protein product, partial [Ixodes persulcatus]